MRKIILLGLVGVCGVFLPVRAATPVTLRVGGEPAGRPVPADALGLSYETSLLRPDAQGRRYFRADNEALLGVFRTLGVRSLRIGGNSVDDPKVPLPAEEDVRSLFAFARAAGVKVIYSVRLQDGDPASAAGFARLIHREFRELLDCFAIGNEPGYYKDYAVYRERWTAIRDAMLREFPDARFCGPDENPNPELIQRLVREFGTADGRLVQITQHSYPFGCSYRNPKDGLKDVSLLVPFDAAEARQRMLAAPPYATYEEILRGMETAVAGTALTFRLTETNSYWFSGLAGASDSYAAALWGLDYLHWWVSRGAAGINFHTGDRTGGSVNLPCRYAAFVSAPGGYEIRPLAYGMKAFALGSAGRYLPVQVGDGAGGLITAYAVRRDDGATLVTVINRDAATDAGVRVELGAGPAIKQVRAIRLQGAPGDVTLASATVRLGGAPIEVAGQWQGTWEPLPPAAMEGNAAVLALPPASAVVLEVRTE